MPQVNIDGKEYDLDQLSDTAKAQIMSLQFVQAELKRLEALTAISKTAEAAYTRALKEEVD